MRVSKYISLTEMYSRKQIDRLIKENRVTINGVLCEHQSTVQPNDIVLIDGEPIVLKLTKPIYIAFNKPPGVTSTAQKMVESNVIDYINHPNRIFPIGRLDKATRGLLLLTNDGSIVNKIMHSEYEHEKEYIVKVNAPITDLFIEKMASGVPILDTVTKRCFVEKIKTDEFRIVLTQGLNRQIRRMSKYLGYEVIDLKRVRIMNISLGDLQEGDWRNLEKEELDELIVHLENEKRKWK